jgi:ribosomal protein L7Ae-like RNA K-turn-binding protein
VDRTRRALDGGELHLVLLARDASGGQLEKVRGLLRHRPVPARWVSGKAALGAALGEGSLSVVGITMRSIAEQLIPKLPPAPPERPGGRGASEGTGGTQSQ